MELKLLVQIGSVEGTREETLRSHNGFCTLGRKGTDVLIPDAKCSLKHAELFETIERSLVLKDLGSANGTYVNGQRVVSFRILQVGDCIRIGRARIMVAEYRS